MSSFTPSPPQAAAIREIRDWFETWTDAQQVFRLFGYAGSGKSTVLKFALDELGLSPHRSAKDGPCVPGVVTATFTGKAALVLTRKGTPARTIHSLIYSVTEATEEEVEAAGKRLREAEDAARRLSGFDRTTAEAAIEAMRQALSAMKHPRFALNPQSDAADARLIVLDEVSMVGEDMARDLMSFGKPILVLGDPGQLPPIKGDGAFTRDEPDVMLTEIHRQAAESAIIRLATMARTGEPSGLAAMTPMWQRCARATSRRTGTPRRPTHLRNERDAAADQQRDARRRGARGHLAAHRRGREGRLPEEPERPRAHQRDVRDAGGYRRRGQPLLLGRGDGRGRAARRAGRSRRPPEPAAPLQGAFRGPRRLRPNSHDRDWKDKKHLTEATFGWAITAHRAEGSQWENVIVWDDGLGRTEIDRRRWLYTAITRAERGLVLLA